MFTISNKNRGQISVNILETTYISHYFGFVLFLKISNDLESLQ